MGRTKRMTSSVLLVVMHFVLATGVCAHATHEADLKAIGTRFTELVKLAHAGNYEEAVNYYTVDCLIMFQMESDVNGREALLELYKEIVPTLKHWEVEGAAYSEIFDGNTAAVYDQADSIDEFGKPWAMYREFIIWKMVGGEWYIDSLIFNDHL